MKTVELAAFTTCFISFITPENIAIVSGAASICLSLSGILLNLYNIKNNNKK